MTNDEIKVIIEKRKNILKQLSALEQPLRQKIDNYLGLFCRIYSGRIYREWEREKLKLSRNNREKANVVKKIMNIQKRFSKSFSFYIPHWSEEIIDFSYSSQNLINVEYYGNTEHEGLDKHSLAIDLTQKTLDELILDLRSTATQIEQELKNI